VSRPALVPINVPARSSAPSTPTLRAGDMYWNTSNSILYVYSGTAWIATNSGGGGGGGGATLSDVLMLGGM